MVSTLSLITKPELQPFFLTTRKKQQDSSGKFWKRRLILLRILCFLQGRSLQYIGKYDEAVEKLSEYLKSSGKKNDEMVETAKKYIEECKAAAEISKDTLRIEIKTLDLGINTVADEYAEVLSADGTTMYFASRRPLSNSSKYEDAKYDENILYSTLINNTWGLTRSVGKNLTYKILRNTPLPQSNW